MTHGKTVDRYMAAAIPKRVTLPYDIETKNIRHIRISFGYLPLILEHGPTVNLRVECYVGQLKPSKSPTYSSSRKSKDNAQYVDMTVRRTMIHAYTNENQNNFITAPDGTVHHKDTEIHAVVSEKQKVWVGK